ncbi:MAG: 3-dehydroquinate synthase [Bacteroidales bacterium]|nr:3-dehydroquinate synthase [Bacteroidales bacterium]
MRVLEVKAESKISKVLIGEKLSNLGKYINNRKSVIITDSNLLTHYKNSFPQGVPVIETGLGEKNKTLQTLEYLFDKLIELEADRSTFIVAIGGGIVCDVAGYAASSYMRGLPFGFVSTTLLSQVDASVGGKNGVNFRGFKNMIGVFNQPEFVICDTNMLKTLEKKEFLSGFSEIVKAGAIKNAELFGYCENNSAEALSMNNDILAKMVYDAVMVKKNVVEADEHEKGERRLLNFGHTFAHAIEKHTGILHGEAVSIGMVLATKVSEKLGLVSKTVTEQIKNVLMAYSLPTAPNIDIKNLFEAMKQDKKREGSDIHLVLLENIGKAVTKKITYNELEKIIHDLRSDF